MTVITFFIVSNIGLAIATKLFHAPVIVVVMAVHTVLAVVLMLVQIPDSHVVNVVHFSDSQSVIAPQFLMIAMTTTTAATTAKIIGIAGRRVPVKKVPTAASAPPSTNKPPNVVKMVIIETMNGANSIKPVANPPTTMIICFIPGERLLKNFEKVFKCSDIDFSIGANTSAKEAPKSAMAIVKLF